MSPPVLCIYVTFINTTSSLRWRRALQGSARLIGERVEDKNGKHLLGCLQRERGFLPIVWTIHGGIGPPMAKLWLDSIFNHSYIKERIAGGSGIETSKRKNAFFQCLHACHTIGTSLLISYCTHPPASTLASANNPSSSTSAANPPPPTDPPPTDPPPTDPPPPLSHTTSFPSSIPSSPSSLDDSNMDVS